MFTTAMCASNRFFTKAQNHIFLGYTFKCTPKCITISVIYNLNKYSPLFTPHNKAISLVIIT